MDFDNVNSTTEEFTGLSDLFDASQLPQCESDDDGNITVNDLLCIKSSPLRSLMSPHKQSEPAPCLDLLADQALEQYFTYNSPEKGMGLKKDTFFSQAQVNVYILIYIIYLNFACRCIKRQVPKEKLDSSTRLHQRLP